MSGIDFDRVVAHDLRKRVSWAIHLLESDPVQARDTLVALEGSLTDLRSRGTFVFPDQRNTEDQLQDLKEIAVELHMYDVMDWFQRAIEHTDQTKRCCSTCIEAGYCNIAQAVALYVDVDHWYCVEWEGKSK